MKERMADSINENKLRVDFHCHTNYSRDSLTTPESLVRACLRKELDRIVITDHNTIQGALAALRLDPALVIVGEEIMTTRGELLAVYVNEEVPEGLTPQETIRILRAQGAFISVSHPFDRLRKGSWDLVDLLEIIPVVDAIEGFNARCMKRDANPKALAIAREHGLAITAGSDAHAAFEIGAAAIIMELFQNADELRQVIREGRLIGKASPWWVHLVSQYAKHHKKG
jgi:predicted metal-dependent phosphoesterase TrpH